MPVCVLTGLMNIIRSLNVRKRLELHGDRYNALMSANLSQLAASRSLTWSYGLSDRSFEQISEHLWNFRLLQLLQARNSGSIVTVTSICADNNRQTYREVIRLLDERSPLADVSTHHVTLTTQRRGYSTCGTKHKQQSI